MAFDPARICPTVTGYSYRTDAGLVRTPMTDGVIRQRRRWRNARATLNLRFVFDLEELAAADAFLAEVGADWWTITLLTGQGGATPVLHTVRLTADPEVRAVAGAARYEYLLTVETQGETAWAGSSS